MDITATQTSESLNIHGNIIDWFYHLFRIIIYLDRIEAFKKIEGGIEVDESYFWAKRKRGMAWKLKRGRWTLEQPVFGLIKRKDAAGRVEIYTEIIPNCKAITLKPIIEGEVRLEDTVLYSDGWKGYDGLVDIWLDKHYRVNHWEHEFSKWNGIHINGIENFWSFTKRRLNKFNGVKINFRLRKTNVELEETLLIMIHKFCKKS